MIDPDTLPMNALIDTGVLLRFLGEQADEHAAVCKELCDAMIDGGRELYIAAPTIAEVSRKAGKPVPRVKGMVVVPFDDRAAELLGREMPMAKLHETKTATGLSITYLKFDAMIAACALRSKTKTMIALDGDHSVLAKGLGFSVRHPNTFLRPQLSLPLIGAVDATSGGRAAPLDANASAENDTSSTAAATPVATVNVQSKSDEPASAADVPAKPTVLRVEKESSEVAVATEQQREERGPEPAASATLPAAADIQEVKTGTAEKER